MKHFKIIILLLVLFTQVIAAQQYWSKGRMGPPGRVAELEKIRLIEVLNLDEETTLKFFSRRNMHQEKMRGIAAKRDSLIENLYSKIENKNTTEYRTEIEEVLDIEKELTSERGKFFNSLGDILSYEQIAQLLVFEKKFRNEIREQILKHGRRGWQKNKPQD